MRRTGHQIDEDDGHRQDVDQEERLDEAAPCVDGRLLDPVPRLADEELEEACDGVEHGVEVGLGHVVDGLVEVSEPAGEEPAADAAEAVHEDEPEREDVAVPRQDRRQAHPDHSDLPDRGEQP